MHRFLITALALAACILLLTVDSSPDPTAQAAQRSIPWNCADWQESPAVADADDARVSMILESLAANRGKAIYCAIDQSDTWTKSETWEAGRDRNERDDTVYFGQSGNFRGFLAAQEGYLTDGESGVTGVSRDLIFEFPREPKKRRRYKYIIVTESSDPIPHDTRTCYPYQSVQYPNHPGGHPYIEGCRRALNWGSYNQFPIPVANNDRTNATHWPSTARSVYGNPSVNWAARAQEAATAHCLAQGWERAVAVAAGDPAPTGAHDWVYERQSPTADPSRYRAARVNTWTATCEKDVRRRVRR